MAKKKADDTNRTPALKITSTRPGFRRAGITHPAEAVIHPAGTFTEDQVEQLFDEPVLIVEEVDEPAPQPPAA